MTGIPLLSPTPCGTLFDEWRYFSMSMKRLSSLYCTFFSSLTKSSTRNVLICERCLNGRRMISIHQTNSIVSNKKITIYAIA